MQTSNASNRFKYPGYSLIEILFVIGIFAAISVFLLPFAISQIGGTKIRESTKSLESLVYLQRQNGFTSQNSDGYGVYFESNRYTLFEGDSFATATATEQFPLPEGISFSLISLTNSSSELVFEPGSFRPSESGFIVVTDQITNYTLEINSEGLIDIQ